MPCALAIQKKAVTVLRNGKEVELTVIWEAAPAAEKSKTQ